MIWIVLAAAGVIPVAVTIWVAWRSLSPPRQGVPDPVVVSRNRAEVVSLETEGKHITAYRVMPESEPLRGVVVLIHGWGSSGSDMLAWSRFLAQSGWGSLAVDLRGHGAGEREPVMTLPDLARDVHAAFEWAQKQPGWQEVPHALLGHSMGGAASLYAISQYNLKPAALILSGAFARVEIITEYVLKKWRIPTFPFGHLVKAVWKLRTGIDLKALEPEITIRKIQVPILATHGALDPVVPAGEMQRLLSKAPPGTESIEIPGAGHSDLFDYQEYRDAVVSFLNRSVYSVNTSP